MFRSDSCDAIALNKNLIRTFNIQMKHLLEKLISYLSYFYLRKKAYCDKSNLHDNHFPQCMSALTKRLVIAKSRIIKLCIYIGKGYFGPISSQ